MLSERGFTLIELLTVIAIISGALGLEAVATRRTVDDAIAKRMLTHADSLPKIKPQHMAKQSPGPGDGLRRGDLPEGRTRIEAEQAIAGWLALEPAALPGLRRLLAAPDRVSQALTTMDENGDGRVDLEELQRFHPGGLDPALAGPLGRVLDAARRELGLEGMAVSERRSVSVPIPELSRWSHETATQLVGRAGRALEREARSRMPLEVLARRDAKGGTCFQWKASPSPAGPTGDTEWKHSGARRWVIFLESSVTSGLDWAAFEPNAEPFWARVRETIAGSLRSQWRAGALQGRVAEEAFYVRCDRTTMTRIEIDAGRLVCLVGVAPSKPAEFAVYRLERWAGKCE